MLWFQNQILSLIPNTLIPINKQETSRHELNLSIRDSCFFEVDHEVR